MAKEEVEVKKEVKEEGVEVMDSAHVDKAGGLERRQSRITFDVPPKKNVGDADVLPMSVKARTLSMEMHEAFDALHREEEGRSCVLLQTNAAAILTESRTRRS